MNDDLENQNSGPQDEDNQESVPEGSIFDSMPTLDENDEPIEDGNPQDDAEAGEKTDEPKALNVSDELEIVVGDEKVTGSEIKELLTLRDNYTQQRQSDTERVRQIEQKALNDVSEKVQDYAAFTNEALRIAESIALGGYTREQIKMLWRTDPDSAAVLDARASQFDNLITQASGQVQKWKSEYQSFKDREKQIKTQADQELSTVEMQKLFASPQSQEIRRDAKKIVSYANQHKIPNDRLDAFMSTADGVKVVYQSMLYEQMQQRIKSGKQPPKAFTGSPGSRPAAQKAAQTSQKALYERAQKGDKAARASWLSSAIPTI